MNSQTTHSHIALVRIDDLIVLLLYCVQAIRCTCTKERKSTLNVTLSFTVATLAYTHTHMPNTQTHAEARVEGEPNSGEHRSNVPPSSSIECDSWVRRRLLIGKRLFIFVLCVTKAVRRKKIVEKNEDIATHITSHCCCFLDTNSCAAKNCFVVFFSCVYLSFFCRKFIQRKRCFIIHVYVFVFWF